MITRNKKHIPLALTIVAAVLLFIGAFNARLVFGDYGLISGFPVIYFIGLGLLTLAASLVWYYDDNHPRLLLVQLLMLIAALWLAPAFAGGSHPSTNHALRSLGYIEYMSRTGDLGGHSLPYLSWPGAYIVPAYINRWLGISMEPLIDYAPFITQLFCLAPLYVFLRNMAGNSKYVYVGMWLFYLANWTASDYLIAAPALGMVLLLVLLALVTTPSLWERGRSHWKMLLAIVTVFAVLVVTHLLSTLVALGALLAVVLVKRRKSATTAMLVCIILMVGWCFTGARGYTSYILGDLKVLSSTDSVVNLDYANYRLEDDEVVDTGMDDEVDSSTVEDTPVEDTPVDSPAIIHPAGKINVPVLPMFQTGAAIMVNPDMIIKGQVSTYVSGNDAHKMVALTKVLYSGLFVILTGIGVVVTIRKKEGRSDVLLVFLIGLIPLGLLALPYAGRMAERLYLTALIPCAYFAVRLVLAKPKVIIPILCIVFVLCLPIHFICHYGNHAYDYVSEKHKDGMHYYHENSNPDEWSYVMSLTYPWMMQDVEKVFRIPVEWLSYSDGKLHCAKGADSLDWWFFVTRQDKALYDMVCDAPYFVDEVETLLRSLDNVTLVYHNDDFSLYKIDMVVP